MISNKIYFLRERDELTQVELAQVLHLPRVSISNWERCIEIPNIKHLNTLANYFKVTLDYIMNLDEENHYSSIKNFEIDKMVVGKKIREIRKIHHLTLRDLSAQLNTTSSTISAYETGKTMLLTSFAYQICVHYHVSMDWLYGRI